MWPFIWTGIPVIQWSVVPSFVKSGSGKLWKVYDNNNANDDRQDTFWSEKLTGAFSSSELKIQFVKFLSKTSD